MAEYIAVMPITNTIGIGIISIDSERIKYQYMNGDKVSRISDTKLYQTTKGRYYFMRYSMRYYIDEFIRF